MRWSASGSTAARSPSRLARLRRTARRSGWQRNRRTWQTTGQTSSLLAVPTATNWPTTRRCETGRQVPGHRASRGNSLLARRISGKNWLMSASDRPGQKQSPEDDTKRKFREALEAKQGRKGEDHIDNAPQHVHAHGPAETKR